MRLYLRRGAPRLDHYCWRTVRRSATPAPSIPSAIATASVTSMPVRGSVVDGGSAGADDDEVVVAAVAPDDTPVELVVVDGGGVLEGDVDELVEGAVECVVEVEPEWPLDPDGDDPASGSTYCWSPAEPPPPASATLGMSIASAAIMRRLPSSWRRQLTRRVLHQRRRAPAFAGRRSSRAGAARVSCKLPFCRIYCKGRLAGHGRDGSC